MSLLNRKPLKIGRSQRTLRDDLIFVVATEDSDAPQQYFAQLSLSSVKVIPTPKETSHSAPEQVVERLKSAYLQVKSKKQEGDEFWVFLDVDHHFAPNHIRGTLSALQTARQAGFEVAISNPSFELWLLLHHKDVPLGTTYSDNEELEQELRQALGGTYNKSNLKPGQFTLDQVPDAIRRARALEANPDAPNYRWPQTTGTHVYRLLERVMSAPR